MRSGSLDRQVVIQTLTTAQDAGGEEIATWTDSVTVWARIIPQKGSERFSALQLIGKGVTTFEIRYRDGMNLKDFRLRFDSKSWDIIDIRIIGRRVALHLDATARSDA